MTLIKYNLLTILSNNAIMFLIQLSPSKRKMLLQDGLVSAPESIIRSEMVERNNHFICLGSLVSPDGVMSNEISARIRKARLAFPNLCSLWRTQDFRLPIKERVYCSIVRSVLIYGCKTWLLVEELLVIEHRCLRSIDRVFRDHPVSNT